MFSFGNEVRLHVPAKTTKPVYPDGYYNPFAVFRFRYRSRGMRSPFRFVIAN
jgi:hypothetical protein